MKNVINYFRVRSIAELNNLVQNHIIEGNEYYPRFNIHFRGLPNKEFALQTRIANQYNDPKIVHQKSEEIFDFFWGRVQAHNLENEFYSPAHQIGAHDRKYYLLSQAQHIGVPTLLMDWSFNWRNALYFAIDNTTFKHMSGTLWVLLRYEAQVDDEAFQFTPTAVLKPYLINPAFDLNDLPDNYVGELRRYRQAGQFLLMPKNDCVTPLENNIIFPWKLINIEILPELKDEIIKLRDADVNDELINIMREYRMDFREYDNAAMYGTMNEKLKKAVNETRTKFGFPIL